MILRRNVFRHPIGLQTFPQCSACESPICSSAPLHRRADCFVWLRADHADLFAVVDERHARQHQHRAGGNSCFGDIAAEHGHDTRLIVIGEKRRPATGGKSYAGVPDRFVEQSRVPGARGLHCRARHAKREVRIQLVGVISRQNLRRLVRHLANRKRAWGLAANGAAELAQHVVRAACVL